MAQVTPLSGLAKWVDRDEWPGDFEDTFLDHVETACQDAKVAPVDRRDLIGDFIDGVIRDGDLLGEPGIERRSLDEPTDQRDRAPYPFIAPAVMSETM